MYPQTSDVTQKQQQPEGKTNSDDKQANRHVNCVSVSTKFYKCDECTGSTKLFMHEHELKKHQGQAHRRDATASTVGTYAELRQQNAIDGNKTKCWVCNVCTDDAAVVFLDKEAFFAHFRQDHSSRTLDFKFRPLAEIMAEAESA